MAAKGGSSGGNKNTVMGIVLGILVLAIAGVLWMNRGDEEAPAPEEKQEVVAPSEPETTAPRPTGRAPDRETRRESRAEEPEAPKPEEPEGGRAPTRGRNQPAPEKLNTSPPA